MNFGAVSVLLAIHLAGFALWTGILATCLIEGGRSERSLRVCLIAMPVTLLSGWALAFAEFGSPAAWPWAIDAMQTAGLGMAVILLIAWFGAALLLRDAEAAGDAEAMHQAARRLTRLLAADLLLGVLALGLAVAGRFG